MDRKLWGKSGMEKTKLLILVVIIIPKNDKIMYKDVKGLN